jgi:hypothetical protein
LIISCSAYSQKSPIDIFNSYIDEGQKFVNEGNKNKIAEKFDQGISTFKKAQKHANLRSLGDNYIQEAEDLIEKAQKAKTNMQTLKVIADNKPSKSYPKKTEPGKSKTEIKTIVDTIQYINTDNEYTLLSNAFELNLKNYNDFLQDSKPVYNDYAAILIQNNKLAEAKTLYTKFLKYDPHNPDINYEIFKLDFKVNPSKHQSYIENQNEVSQLLLYLRLNLEEKKAAVDQNITKKILQQEDTPEIRDQIATIYLEETGISHFKELFLTDASKIKEYREYFFYTKFIQDPDETTESIKSFNKKSLEYYSNLVDLDVELLKTNPTDAENIRNQSSVHYNNLGWYSLLCQKPEKTLDYFNESIKYSENSDNDNDVAKGNIPHAYLFNNQFEEAKKLYLKLKDEHFKSVGDNPYTTYKDAFLDDFASFRAAGIKNKGMDEIEVLLNKP